MSQVPVKVKWCWDYEVKHLGSYPTAPPYTGHNKPVEIVELSALREVVEGLRVLRTYTNMQEDERNERLDAILASLGEVK